MQRGAPNAMLQLVSLAVAAVVGCKSDPPTGATPSASAPGSSQAGAVASAGPVVPIPVGKLTAGTACGDHPRLPSEELAAVPFDLGAFDIDVYPYPNDPTKPALTGVSQAEARAMCAARGRRLCTELEWERACKGPKNTRYEYGDRFDAKRCSTSLGTVANQSAVGSLEGCKSEFGVFAMHGFVFEWTASAWGRGAQEGLFAQRGGFGNQPFAHHRCSAVRAAGAEAKDASTGFRCCGGAENAARVEIAKDERPVLEPVEPLEPTLLARLKSALSHGGMKPAAGGELGIDKAIDILTDQFRRTLHLLGMRSAAELRAHGRELLVAP